MYKTSETVRNRQIAACFFATALALLLPSAAHADTLTWTGAGANKKWSTTANWSPAQAMTASDTANFQTGTLSSDTVTYDSGTFANITVQSGAWTVNVSSACFTNRPITIASGAKFALSGASARGNPFSTENNANAVAGLLDLGGAKQTISTTRGDDGLGFFRNGGEIRNGTLTINGTVSASFKNRTFTIGSGANVKGAVRLYLNGARLVIDGGSLNDTQTGSNHPIGNGSEASVTVRNGGRLTATQETWLGFKKRGQLIGDHGTIDIGGNVLYLAIRDNAPSVLALTNSTLTCGVMMYGYSTDYTIGQQKVILKDSVVNLARLAGRVLHASSSLLFDGATLVPTAARSDFLPASDKIPTPTLGAGGLIVSNNYDVTIAKGMAGAGRLVKAGSSTLTLSGANTFTGGIEVRKGTLAIDAGAVFANSTLSMADGTTLKLKVLPGYEFATTNLALALNANTSGKVTVEFDLTDGFPEEGRTYRLFAPGLDAATLSNRIAVVPDKSFTFAFAQDGALTLTFQHTPVTRVWTGGGADAKWTTTDNWDVDSAFGALDSVVFGGTGSSSIYDGTDGLPLWDITVNSGCHTANVATASFANSPLAVASGAAFVLENAAGVVNPFSTVADANTLAGLLDLGGATQTITTPMTGDNTGFFRDGCEIRNGTLTVNQQSDARLRNTTLTIGPGATVSGRMRVSLDNARIVVDGGTFHTTYTDPQYSNNPIGRDHEGMIVLRNGGRFLAAGEVWLGFNANATMAGEDAVIDAGNNGFYMSIHNAASLLALTNSTLTCGRFMFGYPSATDAGVQTAILKDTTVNLSKFGGACLPSGSSLLFDGVTLVPKAAATDFMPASANLPTPTIGAGGLIVSNACDVTIAKGIAGAGGLVKTDVGVLTLSGSNTFTGGIDVREGTLALNPGASFPNATPFAMADGTTLRLKASPDGFASTNVALVLNANTDGKVAIEIDTSSGILESGRVYTLFSSGFDSALLSRITIDPAYALALAEGGALTLTFSPTTHIWTGAGADTKWSTGMNWNVGDPIVNFDHVVFSVGGYSVYDCADGLRLGSITAGYGCHTVDVETASFANVPISVASGAAFALANAGGVTNPFSTVTGTNVIAGILDLGGATQTISSTTEGNNTGTFRDGGEIRNGSVELVSGNWCYMHQTAFTVGPDAHVSTSARLYLENNAHLKIDGGTFTTTFYSSSAYDNSHVVGGYDAPGTLEVSNGGRFEASLRCIVGHQIDGSIIGDGGIIDFAHNPIFLSNNNGARATLALTNATLTCSSICIGYDSNKGNTQTVVLKDTLVNLMRFVYNHKTAESSILLDGTTFVPKEARTDFMPSGLPSPTIGPGGLVISNAFDVTAAVGMKGAGGIVKKGNGKLTLTGAQTFAGDVVVSNGAFAASSTFAGGLLAASGTAIDLANATFAGRIVVENGVVPASTNGVNWVEVRAVPVAKSTAGISCPRQFDANGRHYFTKTLQGMHWLYYGKQAGLIITFQ